MDWRNHITTNAEGKIIIKGTKVSVEQLMDKLAQGWTLEELLEGFPHMRHNDLLAVFAYLQECVKDKEIK